MGGQAPLQGGQGGVVVGPGGVEGSQVGEELRPGIGHRQPALEQGDGFGGASQAMIKIGHVGQGIAIELGVGGNGLKSGESLLPFFLAFKGHPEIEADRLQVGLGLQDGGENLRRLRPFFLLEVDQADFPARLQVIGGELEEGVQLGQGFVQTVLQDEQASNDDGGWRHCPA